MTDKERIAELEKERQELLESVEGATMMYKDLQEARKQIERLKWHDLRKNPEDLPQCDENTQLIFYVKDWNEIRNDYYYHFALGFYRPAFLVDGEKMFVEEGKGYLCEHSPKYVIMWKELVPPEVKNK